MKIKDGFMLKEIAGTFVVVPKGSALVDFQMMLSLNETGVFLWELLSKGAEKEDLYNAILSEYDVDEDTAKKDVDDFLLRLESKKVIEK